MSDNPFETLRAELDSRGPESTFEQLAGQLRAEKKYHELFDARLMQSRHRAGLPVDQSTGLDDLPEPLRSQTEEAYLEACREIGQLLLDERRYREAWMYLRAAGEKQRVAEALCVEPTQENVDEMVEVALHEGAAPRRGFQLVLEHYGTCNAITTFEGTMPAQPLEDQRACAATLVGHLHGELVANVRAHVEKVEGKPTDQQTIAEIVVGRDWLFEGGNYHIDTSHLASTVRFARLLIDPQPVRQALDLTEYGRRLTAELQYAGEEPFVDLYPSHALLFAASLGRQTDEAVRHFGGRAEALSVEEEGTAAVETYLILLARLDRHADALEAWARLVPPGAGLSPYAPTMIQLAQKANRLDRFLEICRERSDRLGYVAGLVAGR